MSKQIMFYCRLSIKSTNINVYTNKFYGGCLGSIVILAHGNVSYHSAHGNVSYRSKVILAHGNVSYRSKVILAHGNVSYRSKVILAHGNVSYRSKVVRQRSY